MRNLKIVISYSVRISYNTYHCFDFSKWENELEQTGKIRIENKSYRVSDPYFTVYDIQGEILKPIENPFPNGIPNFTCVSESLFDLETKSEEFSENVVPECPICLEEFCQTDESRTNESGTLYHRKCLVLWDMANKRGQEDCPICYEELCLLNEDYTETECHHFFHKKCLIDWIKLEHHSCPICRKPFSLKEEKKYIRKEVR